MKGNLYFYNFQRNLSKLRKLCFRLQKKIRNGNFHRLSSYQQHILIKRLIELLKKLEQLKPGVAATVVGTSLAFIITSSNLAAQTFTRDKTNDPLTSVPSSSYAKPTFADLDNDGDLDAVIGGKSSFSYFKNTGTSTAPVFTQQGGSNNPFSGIIVSGGYSTPHLADVDGDGDYDMLSGHGSGSESLIYYKNTGTAASPAIQQQLSIAGLFSGGTVPSGKYLAPVMVDVDGDGDKDLFLGEYGGTITYYQNTGTATSPSFTLQTGSNNPLSTVSGLNHACPAFADIDNDGDYDVLIGTAYPSNISFYNNTGSAISPTFTLETSSNNPFGSSLSNISDLRYSAPAFADIDGDGDMDLFVGDNATSYFGTNSIEFFRNDLITVSGITSSLDISNVAVFPNPVRDNLNVNLKNQSGNFSLVIMNSFGIEVKKETVIAPGSTSININDLREGIYLLKLIQDNKVITIKFVKE